ncbi:hypothetical protein SKAU_G00018060 [Synaphobranchus kaupii]|uniref:Uncharacterized protein n=1 Tax=Synaphobranchus kaupii TaxID=118154 RepID=A0A9Q1JCU8_SYNKA|nr:hypothetical protein SKAU_G00018060 [Synaphobranchus kaupii]
MSCSQALDTSSKYSRGKQPAVGRSALPSRMVAPYRRAAGEAQGTALRVPGSGRDSLDNPVHREMFQTPDGSTCLSRAPCRRRVRQSQGT